MNSGELHDHDDVPCPDVLAPATDPVNRGFGTSQPATRLPSLLTPTAVWICVYEPDLGSPHRHDPVTWRLQGPIISINEQQAASIASDLTRLRLADPTQACFADLGPRWAVITSHEGDLTGVVVDAFGCGDVRLTPEPFTTPPGQSDGNGIVAGYLSAPARLYGELKALS